MERKTELKVSAFDFLSVKGENWRRVQRLSDHGPQTAKLQQCRYPISYSQIIHNIRVILYEFLWTKMKRMPIFTRYKVIMENVTLLQFVHFYP